MPKEPTIKPLIPPLSAIRACPSPNNRPLTNSFESVVLNTAVESVLLPVCESAGCQTGEAVAEASHPFLRRPDVHGDKIVFTSEADLWIASISTGLARRITRHPGMETNAHFSPDGRMLGFNAQYDGATDVYVTPYLGVDQVTSGAMARAVFFGKAIVSTPFLYAIELLANGRGRLVPFKDSAALAREVAAVLSDDALRASMEAGTRSLARGMSWGAVAHKYAAIFSRASAAAKGRVFTAISTVTAAVPPPQRMGQRKSGAATGAAEPVGSGRR